MDKEATSYIGKIFNNRYNVIDCVGVGGMAYVLKAHDTLMNRTVAIKILNDSNSSDAAAVRRFVNESKAVAMLSNPNIVSIYDVAFEEDVKYIVMEYIDGITLKEYISKHGKLDWHQAVEFTEQILKGLEHAHEKGVIHRDIKPQNVLILKNGLLKVTDFGIAKIPSDETIKLADKAMGTVYYISPEQASGKPTSCYTDIYSVGVMLYEMVTGKLPFDGDTPLSIAMKQIKEQPVPPRKIDPSIRVGLEQIILKAMSKNPEDRFKSARTMLRAINIFNNNPDVIFDAKPREASGKAKKAPTATKAPAKTALTEKSSADKSEAKDKNRKVSDTPEKKAKKTKETKPEKPKRAKRSMFPIILGIVVAMFMVIGIFGAFLVINYAGLNSSDQSFVVTVPDLVGSTFSESTAEGVTKSNCIINEIEYVYKNDVEEGLIISQSPAGGSERKLSSEDSKLKMQIVVSKGAKSRTVPDIDYYSLEKAKSKLEKAELEYEIKEANDDFVEPGFVIGCSPDKGTTVKAGQKVTVTVSKGAEAKYMEMINVVGYSLDEAKKKLVEKGLIVGKITRKESSNDKDIIISQSVNSGEKVKVGTTVIDLTVSE